jgi:hypothetical protein
VREVGHGANFWDEKTLLGTGWEKMFADDFMISHSESASQLVLKHIEAIFFCVPTFLLMSWSELQPSRRTNSCENQSWYHPGDPQRLSSRNAWFTRRQAWQKHKAMFEKHLGRNFAGIVLTARTLALPKQCNSLFFKVVFLTGAL